jgi:hypothetical protein
MKTNAGLVVALLSLAWAGAQAKDMRCDVPPYGDSTDAFRSYVDRTMALVIRIGPDIAPTIILPKVCNAKFNGTDRTPFYNLGFTPEDFNTKSVTDLALQWLIALKNFADKIPDEAFK